MTENVEGRPRPEPEATAGVHQPAPKHTPPPCPGCGVMPTQSGYDHGFVCWVLVDLRRGRVDDIEYFRTHSSHDARIRYMWNGERVQLEALTGNPVDRYAVTLVRREDLL